MESSAPSLNTKLDPRLAKLSPEKRALLMKRLREQAATKAKAQDGEIPVVPRDYPLPLSFPQQRLWFLSQFEEASMAYHIAGGIKLEGRVELELLDRAFQTVVQRHEALRTTFQVQAGKPVQVIAPSLTIPIETVDLRSFSANQQQSQYDVVVQANTQTPFDLKTGPLVRVSAIYLADTVLDLVVTMHHIISDGWSIGVLMQEVFTLYQAFYQGLDDPLPPLSIQYPDFAHWQRERLQGEVLAHQLNYWQETLAGAPALLELPGDRPRPPVHRFRGQSLLFELSTDLVQALKNITQETNTTLFMVLDAALAVLLYRLSGQPDIVIGSPIANRTRKALEPLIGLFVNTLLLRHDCANNPSFRDFLLQVQRMALDAYQHQDVPFEQLVDALKTERTLSYTPLFQVMFALQNAPMEAVEMADFSITPLDLENATAKFDLTIIMEEDGDCLTGVWEYNQDLFDAATAERMVSQFQTLLAGIAENPQQPLLALPLLTPAEHHKIVVEWNQTEAPYPPNTCLHQLFEAQVERTPDVMAAITSAHRYTYAELNQRSNQLAHFLRTQGFQPGDFAGICLDRSLDMVVALFGVLKAGGVYVPMDPTYPADRLSHMLTDAQVSVLLTQSHLEGRLPEHAAKVVSLDTDWPVIAQQPTTNLLCTRQATDLAYVIYTSGSTGKPKGVMIDHRGAVNTIADINRRYQVGASDRVLGLSSLSFDLSVYDIFGFLAVGGAIVIPEPEAALNPSRWWELIDQEQVTLWNTAPAVMELFLNYVIRQGQRIPASLRTVMMSGDAISVTLPDQIWAYADNANISINSLGGATEGSIWSICYPIDAVDPDWISVPYGQPLDNQAFYILDPQLQPVPVGVPGELHIGGLGVALGYLNRPELNEKRFLADPFSDRPNARLYKTGDLGRYRSDGVIEFLGRIDNQVKIRGFRVELGEIETLLLQQEGIRETVVVVWEPQPGDQRLCAYLVMDEGHACVPSQLRNTLREQLPTHMVPAVFMAVPTIPLTANGKVDRKALPTPTDDGSQEAQSDVAFVQPKTPTERAIATVWQDLLHIDQVGTQDNFFDLGGHSLLMVQVHAQLQSQLDSDLTIVELFQYPTIAALADYVEQKQTAVSAAEQGQQRQAVRSQRQQTVAQRRQVRQQHRRGR